MIASRPLGVSLPEEKEDGEWSPGRNSPASWPKGRQRSIACGEGVPNPDAISKSMRTRTSFPAWATAPPVTPGRVPPVPSNGRQKPGPKPAHEGGAREPLTAGQKIALHVPRCGRCHGELLRFRGAETRQEIEMLRRAS